VLAAASRGVTVKPDGQQDGARRFKDGIRPFNAKPV